MKRIVFVSVGLFAASVIMSGCICCKSACQAPKAPAAVAPAAPAEVKPPAPTVYRTWIGVGMGVVADEDRGSLPLQPGTGLIITQVMDDSPASKAGIQEDDILVKLNDQILIYPLQLRALVRLGKPDETVIVTALRDGKETRIPVKLGREEVTEWNADQPPTEEEEVEAFPEGEFAWFGVGPDSLSDDERAGAKLAPGIGLILRSVFEDGPAAKGGLQEGDIVVRYNDQLLTYPVQLRKLVKLNKPGETVTVTVQRDGKDSEMKVTLGKKTSAEVQQ